MVFSDQSINSYRDLKVWQGARALIRWSQDKSAK
jgi:hypothetical protein